MSSRLALVNILTFVVPLVSALTLNLPKDPITGGQTVLTWTANATDPPSFTIELDQASFHNALGIANNVATSAMTLTLELPSVPPGGGYTLQAVANGDINLVYSATSPFTISSPSTTGSTSVSVAKSSAKSTSSSSPSEIPTTIPASTSGFGVTATAPSTSTSVSITPAGSGTGTPSAAAPATSTSAATFNAALSLKLNFNAGSMVVLLLSALAGVAIVAL